MEKILSLTVRLHCGSEVEEEVLVDTTVQEKNVTFPTDTKLALKIINYCWAYGDQEGVEWRQSYRFVVKRLRLATYNGSHPRRRRAARRAQRKLRTVAGRLVRDLRRKLSAEALAYYTETLDLFEQVLGQRRGTKNKRYSLHEPAVWCIAKGKVRTKYEFGCKVSVVRTALSGIIVGMKSFVGNPCNGDTLAPALAQVERVREDAGGERPRIAVVDPGPQAPERNRRTHPRSRHKGADLLRETKAAQALPAPGGHRARDRTPESGSPYATQLLKWRTGRCGQLPVGRGGV